ncbi:transposase [bacterium]|nr:transposase [bacterium]
MSASDEQASRVSYFVTVRTFGCKAVFHEAPHAERLVELMEMMRREEGFRKYAYAVLPDHYHVLLGGHAESGSVADLIMTLNRAAEVILELPDDGQPLWDDRADVLVLYTPKTRIEKLNYIHNKPVLCGMVESAQDYVYSSAPFYFKRYGKTEF